MMNSITDNDLADMEKKLKHYTQNGISQNPTDFLEEHVISITPDASLIRPLKEIRRFLWNFCSCWLLDKDLKRGK